VSGHYAYSYFDVDLNGAQNIYDLQKQIYDRDNNNEWSPPFPTFEEWEQRNEEKTSEALRDLAEGCAAAFDPWYENNRGSEGYDHQML